VSNLWVTAAAFQVLGEEDYEEPWIHVSPKYMRPGTRLRPPGRGWVNFDQQSTGEHSYMTKDFDEAQEIDYHLHEMGHPNTHWYHVQPHPDAHLEEDPAMPGSVMTRGPVEVRQRTDRFRSKPVYRSPGGDEHHDLAQRW
jgi:hypothetical protein